jgi:hypothetical protein
MKKFGLMIAILAVAAVVAQATPTVTLTATYSGVTWKIYATDTIDNAGLASFLMDIGSGPGMTVLTSVFKAPKPLDNGIGSFAGFSAGFDSAGVVTNGVITGLQGGQVTPYGDVHDAVKDSLVLQGIGNTVGRVWLSSDWDPEGDPNPGTSYTTVNPTLIAQGTFSGSGQMVGLAGSGNVLAGTVGAWVGPGNVNAANFVFATGFVPEPATMALLVVGGFAALRRRR